MPLKTLEHPITGVSYKMGRLTPPPQPRRLLAKRYIDFSKLPTPPAQLSLWHPARGSLQRVYMNDKLGDCAIAGPAHLEGVFTGNADPDNPIIFSNNTIVELYSAISGYKPTDPSTDRGCNEIDVLNYWKNHGLSGAAHKITGWLAVDGANPDEYRMCQWLGEGLLFGCSMPDAWIKPFPAADGFIWDVAGDPDPENGHCFVGTGYKADGSVEIDTWGMRGYVTQAAMAKYASASGGGELYMVISPEIIARATQKAPNGFDWATLLADFQLLSEQ